MHYAHVSRLIRLSSPNLNYIIGLGAFILYLNVVTLVIPATNHDFAAVLCNVSGHKDCFINQVISTVFID